MSAGYDPALFADAASEALSLPCFYLTTHRPNWLWDGRAGYPLMISYRTLRTVARPRRAAPPQATRPASARPASLAHRKR